jgi:hypothetical protein
METDMRIILSSKAGVTAAIMRATLKALVKPSIKLTAGFDPSDLKDDAMLWLQAFEKTAKKQNWNIVEPDSDTLMGWFANIIEVSSAHRLSNMLKAIDEIIQIQRKEVEHDPSNDYMVGLLNGLEVVRSIVSGTEPNIRPLTN